MSLSELYQQNKHLLEDSNLILYDHKPAQVGHVPFDLSNHKNVKWFYHNGKWHFALRNVGPCADGHRRMLPFVHLGLNANMDEVYALHEAECET